MVKLPLLATSGTVLFPSSIIRLPPSDLTSEYKDGSVVVIPKTQNQQYYTTGTIARVISLQQSAFVLLEGIIRAKVIEVNEDENSAVVEPYEETVKADSSKLRVKLGQLQSVVRTLLDLAGVSDSKAVMAMLASSAGGGKMTASKLVDILASVLPMTFAEKLDLLSLVDPVKRIDKAIEIFVSKVKIVQDSNKSLVKVDNSKSNQSLLVNGLKQKESALRQRLDLIKNQLNKIDPKQSVVDKPTTNFDQELEEDDEEGLKDLTKKLNALELDTDARKVVQRELKRLKRMHSSQAEYQICRTYLETIAELPWKHVDQPFEYDLIRMAQKIFDEDHYGLEKVKKRLVEYLAVLYLNQKNNNKKDRPPILLLVGPPGVGKTSLAKSVARALNRKLHRISLGGVRDEAEIRGHRRTYVGAMPGVFVQAMRKIGVLNPVMVLDEIDKLGQGNANFHGDPSAAMLEVLDPEQNFSFMDHYINLPVDLSKVLFIATANTTDTIPRPLLDRMETIYIDGYTYMEKQKISEKYLIPKQLKACGFANIDDLVLPTDVIYKIATNYTREAGVRSLERAIGTICRGKAVEFLNHNNGVTDKVITVDDLQKYLGLEKYHSDVIQDEVDEYIDHSGQRQKRHGSGVVNGLAYMGSGNGGLLTLETSSMPGTGKLKLTGKLGEVFSESGQIALSWVRSNISIISKNVDLSKIDIHLHAPAGAIPKDGPSAGVAMTIALVSLLTNQPVPNDIAMTGEMTLRGKVLEVGGVKEKLLGAHLAGIRRVILPYHCQNVVNEDCKDLLEQATMEIVYVKYIWDVISIIWPTRDIQSHL